MEDKYTVSYVYNFLPYFLLSILLLFFEQAFIGRLLFIFSIYNAFNAYCINRHNECLEKNIIKSIKSPFGA
ncbi:MAG: hypothetical protein ACLR60_18920 [Clostridium paraputrificum]